MNQTSDTSPVAPHVAHGRDNHAHSHEHACEHDGCGSQTPSPPIDTTALISGRGLSVTRRTKSILTQIDIDISAKEIVTLIGPNGSGKTTLVRVLLGIEKPTQGELHRATELRVGYVPQKFDIDPALPMTVDRFLRLGLKTSTSNIETLLYETGAIQTQHSQLSDLSGGELQRILLTRALLANPNLLVLDEPVRGVDYVGEAEFYALLSELRDKRGIGILLVSHDLHMVMAQSDRVICINNHICCSGVPQTVAQHPEYARLFGAEAARTFAVYLHHHDHRHDLSGNPTPTEVKSRV